MGELLSYFRDKYSRSGNRTAIQDSMSKQRVKNSIVSVCEKYLSSAGDALTIEISERDLPFALEVIGDEPLRSRYDIVQVDATLLQCSLKKIDAEDIFE